MRPNAISRMAGLLLAGAISVAGCSTTPRSGGTAQAATPQDKAHQEQLSNMGREDGEAVTSSAKKPVSRQTTSGGRRSGQRVIDQPVRR